MKIGDKVFYFDPNRRVYEGPERKLNYRGYFIETTITGETKTQWETRSGRKLNKKPRGGTVPDPVSSFHDRLYTADEVDDAVYCRENRHEIAELARDCQDADALRKAREILEAAK